MNSELSIGSKIKFLLKNKKREQVILGITGGSGCGKSTIAKAIKDKLSHLNTKYVCLDCFFKPVEKMPKYYSYYLGKEQPNFNTPDSIDKELMVKSCSSISGFDLVILDGHFVLHYQEMRDLIDIKCFVTIDAQEMLDRRTIRNLKDNYGGTEGNIINYNKECVLPMYEQYILPTMKYADILIPNSSTDLHERDDIVALLSQEIYNNFKGNQKK